MYNESFMYTLFVTLYKFFAVVCKNIRLYGKIVLVARFCWANK